MRFRVEIGVVKHDGSFFVQGQEFEAEFEGFRSLVASGVVTIIGDDLPDASNIEESGNVPSVDELDADPDEGDDAEDEDSVTLPPFSAEEVIVEDAKPKRGKRK